MTSQIVIMNSKGLAFASDSAVSSGSNTSNSAQKMFSLPGRQPIAFMVMGAGVNASSGLTWDRVFYKYHLHFTKKYGRDHELGTIKDYQRDFVEFLQNLTSDSHNDLALMRDLYFFFTNSSSYISKGISNEYGAPATEMDSVIYSNVEEAVNAWGEIEVGVEEQYQLKQIFGYHGELINEVAIDIITKILQKPYDTVERNEDLRQLLALNMGHHLVHYSSESGWKESSSTLVMGGFGKEEEYPTYVTINSGSVVKGIEENFTIETNSIDPNPLASIHPSGKDGAYTSRVFIEPFAMKEFMSRMMNGMDTKLTRNNKISRVAEDVTANWLLENGATEIGKVSGIGDATAQKIVEQLLGDGRLPWNVGNDHWKWVNKHGNDVKTEFREAVDRLSPIDLAKLAKHLIENEAIMFGFLKSVKSVDLPVDSCYVTKESGFIWTNLKNLPDREINHKIYHFGRDGTLFL